jgi:hypothetical protein
MQLAQVNVAEAVARLDSPRLRGFITLLTPLDTLARRAPGFVWRPAPDEVDPAELAVFGDPWRVVVNLSVWESLDTLLAFTHEGRHRTALRHRGRWFVRPDRPAVALWWVPDGHRPSFAEAHDRLTHLRVHGPTPTAFSLPVLDGSTAAHP